MRNVRVSIEGLADAVNEALQEYVELATDDMKTAVQNAGITVVNEIKKNAPKDTGKYSKSWRIKMEYEDSTSMTLVVYSPSRYYLAHLLEHGHAKRGGGRVAARPHIADAEKKADTQLEQELVRKMNGY